jgi:hypothetical protein
MGRALVRNNAYSAVAATLPSTATTLTVTAGTGSRFPNVVSGSGNFFYITLLDTSNNVEVVKVTATTGDVFTIQRGQDGTAARVFALNDRIELRPTAALFDDKMSLGGGTFTGHIEVPAGAVDSQVPRADEVLSLSGGTLTGTLFVPALSAPDGQIELPGSQRIKGADVGSLVAPGMIIQTQYQQVNTVATYASVAATPREIDPCTFSFTPKFATSKVLLTYDISGEPGNHNMVFRLTRNGIAIGTNDTVALAAWVGWKNGFYDSDNASTPQSRVMTFMDSPNTTSAIEYKIQFITAAVSTFYLNRAINGAVVGQADYEIATSSVMFQEIAQ